MLIAGIVCFCLGTAFTGTGILLRRSPGAGAAGVALLALGVVCDVLGVILVVSSL